MTYTVHANIKQLMNSEMSYSIAHCIINKNDPIELQPTCLYSNCKLHIMCCTRAMYYISTCTCSVINNISSDESIHVCHYCIHYKINHTHRLFLVCCWDCYMHQLQQYCEQAQRHSIFTACPTHQALQDQCTSYEWNKSRHRRHPPPAVM